MRFSLHSTKTIISATVISVALSVSKVTACTGILVEAKDGTQVVARTMEFGIDLESAIIHVPRGQSFEGETPKGEPGMKWTNRYAYLGENFFGFPEIVDGINEKGLYVGMFYMPGYADFEAVTKENAKKAMAQFELPGWLLGNFSTVDEVKAGLERVVVGNVYLEQLQQVVPVHYMIIDAAGNALTLEYLKGKRVVTDNPVGVLTNAPTFEYMMTNLSNYTHLTSSNAKPLKLEKTTIHPTGQGSGMMGLPGDFTPPSRFIRAVYLSASAFPEDGAEGAVTQAINLINNISIVKGAARGDTPHGMAYDYTLWTTVNDLKNQEIYFRTYDNTQMRKVSMAHFDPNAKNISTIDMNHEPVYRDVSNTAKPLKQ